MTLLNKKTRYGEAMFVFEFESQKDCDEFFSAIDCLVNKVLNSLREESPDYDAYRTIREVLDKIKSRYNDKHLSSYMYQSEIFEFTFASFMLLFSLGIDAELEMLDKDDCESDGIENISDKIVDM